MDWYVFYGSGRMLRPQGTPPSGLGWTLKPFDTEERVVNFAIGCVKDGLAVTVGETKQDVPPKYRTAQIAQLAVQ
jgi:hypothetical protein